MPMTVAHRPLELKARGTSWFCSWAGPLPLVCQGGADLGPGPVCVRAETVGAFRPYRFDMATGVESSPAPSRPEGELGSNPSGEAVGPAQGRARRVLVPLAVCIGGALIGYAG